MSSVARPSFVRPEEYLAQERLAELKSEYCDGRLHSMAGTSFRLNIIAGNLYSAIQSQLRDKSCQPTFGDIRLQLESSGLFTYPDLMIVCGQPEFADAHLDTLLNPTVIIEVLSPSTESWDRGGKFAHYRRLESLQDYVLVSQDRILVEHYTRQGQQWLLTESSGLDGSLRLASIGCEVPLAEIYAKVTFDQDATAEA
jgi:Uma2 family endonuclease